MTNWVTVYDSVNVAAIPADAEVVLAYVDGSYANETAMRARFPRADIVTVTTTGQSHAMMCDCEQGDLTPADVRTWADNYLYTGPLPLVYSSAFRRSQLLTAMASFRAGWWWWAADWTGVPHLVPDAVATQYADPWTSGGDYDISIMAPAMMLALFGKPAIPAPHPRKADMIIINNGTTQYVLCSDGTKVPIDDPADLAALATVLPGSVTLSPAQVDLFPTK